MQNFTLVIGRDEETGVLMAAIPELPGCYTSGDSLSDLKINAKLAVKMFMESSEADIPKTEFFGLESFEM